MSPARLLLIALLALQVATCGQKGPLYLPAPTTLAAAEHAAAPLALPLYQAYRQVNWTDDGVAPASTNS